MLKKILLTLTVCTIWLHAFDWQHECAYQQQAYTHTRNKLHCSQQATPDTLKGTLKAYAGNSLIAGSIVCFFNGQFVRLMQAQLEAAGHDGASLDANSFYFAAAMGLCVGSYLWYQGYADTKKAQQEHDQVLDKLTCKKQHHAELIDLLNTMQLHDAPDEKQYIRAQLAGDIKLAEQRLKHLQESRVEITLPRLKQAVGLAMLIAGTGFGGLGVGLTCTNMDNAPEHAREAFCSPKTYLCLAILFLICGNKYWNSGCTQVKAQMNIKDITVEEQEARINLLYERYKRLLD